MQPRGQGWITITTHISVNKEKRTGNWTVPHPGVHAWQAAEPVKSFYVADSEKMTIWVDHAAFADSIGVYGSSRKSKGKLLDNEGRCLLQVLQP